jgi:hypothetical protein
VVLTYNLLFGKKWDVFSIFMNVFFYTGIATAEIRREGTGWRGSKNVNQIMDYKNENM